MQESLRASALERVPFTALEREAFYALVGHDKSRLKIYQSVVRCEYRISV